MFGWWLGLGIYVPAPFYVGFRSGLQPLVDAASVVPEHPKMLPLPRRVADELVLAAALAHVLVSDISAPWASEVFATDSSDCKGAIVAAPVAPEVTAALWRACPKTAGSARLLSKEEAALRRVWPDREESAPLLAHRPSPKRPPACRFHFLEIWGAPCPISPLLAALGWTVGPRLDPAVSLEYDLCSRRVFEWIAFLLERGRVDALGASLPLATFSPASRPRFRSRGSPLGFPGSPPKVATANTYARRVLGLLRLCGRFGVPAVLLHPAASFAPQLPPWLSLLRTEQTSQERAPYACAPGASGAAASQPYLVVRVCLPTFAEASKAWRYWHLVPDPAGGARDAVAREAAALLDLGLARRTASLALSALQTEGLESVFVNDLALSLPWEVRKAWTWPRPVHINILEASCVYRLVCALAKQSGPLRVVSLCDSNVAKCAIAKGRSPSFGLSPVLRRLAAVSVAFGISCSLVFCPTRLMPADHPSRDSAIPEPVPSALQLSDKPGLLRALVGLPPLRRWASGWVRLVLGLGFPFPWAGGHRDAGRSFRTFVPSPLDFDRTLGFPGEGPASPFALRFCSWVCLVWLLPACFGASSSGSGFVASPPASHGRLAPRNAGDQWRKSRRGPTTFLREGSWKLRPKSSATPSGTLLPNGCRTKE